MSRPVLWVLAPLLAIIAVLSTVVLISGVNEARLATAGKIRAVALGELGDARGWLSVHGCVRHDLAVAVTPSGRVYRPGAESPGEHDRVFTPLAADEECDEDKRPGRLYALVEDDDALATTLGHVYAVHVAPPPVPARIAGVIGYGAGHAGLGDKARAALVADKLDGRDLPLLAKGKQPGVLWVAVVTAAAGAHGYLLCGLAVFWAIRRERRRRTRLENPDSDEEERFFAGETID
jgi:hypothetical protein